MKKLIVFLAVCLIAFSCTHESEEIELNEKTNPQLNEEYSRSSSIVYSRNNLIVKFANGISHSEREAVRSLFEVANFTPCPNCSDNLIELWTFDRGINIEPKKRTIDDPDGGPKSAQGIPLIDKVDYEFYFRGESSNSLEKNNSKLNMVSNLIQPIKSTNDGVTIAVFDTGIDPGVADSNGLLFPDPFLYNSSNDPISGLVSGWDFVNSDNDSFDDHPGLHGTAVTSIITGILNSYTSPISHQILPLKVCDEYGRASYFDLLCATSFALERAEILHMSLGWYDNNTLSDSVDNIFVELMSAHPNAILINSAGNEVNNNDNINNYHFPSGYPLNNIVSVASCKSDYSNISVFSNYGQVTVDYFANGDNILFLDNLIQGTSFAAPKVTAMIAKIKSDNLINNFTTSQILSQLNSLGTICPSTFNINRKVSSNKYLIP